MGDWGIKVARSSYDVLTADPDELVFSSKYKTLRVKTQGSGTITQSGGRMVTIPHSLGYVPYFLVHATADPYMQLGFFGAGKYAISPFVPVVTGAMHLDRYIYSYADANNLYIKLGDNYGYQFFHTGEVAGDYAFQSSPGTSVGSFYCGNDEPYYNDENGAIRFRNVTIDQGTDTLESRIFFYTTWRLGSSPIKYKLYGIDENNTLPFDEGVQAFGRSRTDAYTQADSANPSVGNYETPEATNIVNEILDRGGWNSGNAIGFNFLDNGTSDNNDFSTNYSSDNGPYGSYSYLRVRLLENLCNYKYTLFYNKIE